MKTYQIEFKQFIDLPIEDQPTFIDQSSGSKLSKHKNILSL